MFLHAKNDQTGRMHRLIWVFAGHTGHFVGFVMRRLNIKEHTYVIVKYSEYIHPLLQQTSNNINSAHLRNLSAISLDDSKRYNSINPARRNHGTTWKYRQLSLSQSPGDQTKYFELSVVWDSQFATSFTLYMYMDCLDHRDYNLHVHVFGNDVLEFKYPLTELLISD